MKRQNEALQEIAENITALTDTMRTEITAQRHPGNGADGVRRPRAETVVWRVKHHGLIHQLLAALTSDSGSTSDEMRGRAKPGYRSPAAAAADAALDALTYGWKTSAFDIQPGILEQRGRMATATGKTVDPQGAYRGRLTPALHDIRRLAHTLPEPWPTDTAETTQAWVTKARMALGHDSKAVTLPDVPCPWCRAPLRLPQGLDGDAECVTYTCRDADGGRHRWAKSEWPFLLEQLARSGEGAA